jgi:hypothetical protein
MLNIRILIIGLLFILQFINLFGKQNPIMLFPKSNTSDHWQLTDSVKVFNGDELFTYMDGGAEVYLEYGFEKIAVAQYLVDGKEQIQGEIYQMKEASGAYGNFTFYITNGVTKVDIGTDGAYNDYYLAFWKGPFLVVVSSPLPTDSTINRIKYLASKIANNIESSEARPKMVEKFVKAGYGLSSIKYFNGRYGLSNFFRFTPGNAFNAPKSIGLIKDDIKVIINEYDSNENALLALQDAQAKIAKLASNQSLEKTENGFRYIDPGKNAISCKLSNQYIIVIIDKIWTEGDLINEIKVILNN